MVENGHVSIIIPVFNDAERLRKCLVALQQQTYSGIYEIIVVDNASEENIKSVVSHFECAKYLYESQPGAYAARNRGISEAKGHIIGFTDSDCIPSANWIQKGVEELLATPECGLVVGKIELFFKDADHPTAVELYEKTTAFKQRMNVEVNHWGATANVFTFMSVIRDVGPFDSTLQSGGDVDWGQRIFAADYTQIYAEDCRILHPARHSLKQLSKKVVRVTKGNHDRLKKVCKLSSVEAALTADLISSATRALRPPIESAIRIFLNKDLNGVWQKTQVVYILVIMRYVSAWTKTRLLFSYIREQNTQISALQ